MTQKEKIPEIITQVRKDKGEQQSERKEWRKEKGKYPVAKMQGELK